MQKTSGITPETRLFFDFIKTAGIIGIFTTHFYDVYIGAGGITAMLNLGIWKYLFMNKSSLSSYAGAIFQTFLAFGAIGVDLFIIASGFGIYYSYLSKKTGWLSFYKKRFLRLLPLYYIALLVEFLIKAYISQNNFYPSAEGIKVLAYHFLLIQTFSKSYLYYGVYYFIAVIFQLYIIFPVLTKIVQSKIWRLPFFIFSLLLTPLLNKMFGMTGINFTGVLITDYLPYFLFGMLIADSMFNDRKLHKIVFDIRLSFLSMISLIVTIYLVSYVFHYNKYFWMLIAFITFLAMPFVFSLIKKLKIKPMIDPVSYSAYSFYLLHIPVIQLGLSAILREDIGDYRYWLFLGTCFFLITAIVSYFAQKGYDRILKPFLSDLISLKTTN